MRQTWMGFALTALLASPVTASADDAVPAPAGPPPALVAPLPPPPPVRAPMPVPFPGAPASAPTGLPPPVVQPSPAAGLPPTNITCPTIGQIPAWTEYVDRVVEMPGCYQEYRGAQCETVFEPVYETKCVPRCEYRLEPEYRLRKVPLYRKKKVPVHGQVTVPVFGTRPKPVKVPGLTPCSNEECEFTLFNKQEEVQVGVKRVPKLLGYREETVICGYTNERVQCGWKKVEVPCGVEMQQICIGQREVTRRVGWRPELREVSPPSTQAVREPIVHPCRRVTVVPDGTAWGAPLPGTDEVLTASEFAAELRRVR